MNVLQRKIPMVMYCPTCSQPFLENHIDYVWEGITIWQLDFHITRIAFQENPKTRFRPAEVKLIAILVAGNGQWVSKSAIVSAFEGNGVRGDRLVDVYKCKIRKKFKLYNLPYEIENEWGRALRIIKVSP